MNRRERLLATLHGKPVDRPAINFYEIGGIQMDPFNKDPFNVYNDPAWKPLIDLAENCTDLIRMRSPVRTDSHISWDPQRDFPDSLKNKFFKTESINNGRERLNRTTLTINGNTMSSVTKRQKEVDTIWTVEYLLKSPQDVANYLQVPDEVFTEKINIDPLLQEEENLGDRGIVMVDTEDPLCAAASLLSMEDFTVIAMTEQTLFHQLLEKCARPIHARVENAAAQFPGRLWRIYGSEFAAEPYLPPALFEEYVSRYTRPMIESIHRHGGFVRIHCHGRIRNILKFIVEMGADAIDPIEPPPQGDVELDHVRREYGQDLVLFGNIEIADIESRPPEEFADFIDKTLREGTCCQGRGFVVMPSASPYGRKVSDNTLRNYELLVEKATAFKF